MAERIIKQATVVSLSGLTATLSDDWNSALIDLWNELVVGEETTITLSEDYKLTVGETVYSNPYTFVLTKDNVGNCVLSVGGSRIRINLNKLFVSSADYKPQVNDTITFTVEETDPPTPPSNDHYLNKTGLQYFWNKLKTYVSSLVTINKIKIGNAELPITDKAVTIPNQVSTITRTQYQMNAYNVNGIHDNTLTISKVSGATRLNISAWDRTLQETVFDYDIPNASEVAQATENTLGTIKLNPSENVTLNNDGQLKVGGRMGQFEGTTGLFAPNDREPRNVNNYALLITDAKGMDMSANRALAVVSGYGIACQSASAGTTVYRINNTYSNRIIAKCCENGYAAKDEATSTQQRIVPVVSVKINGQTFDPNSAADDSTNPIEITVPETLNPDSTISNIRLFGKMGSYATAYIGNGMAGASGGRNLLIGGGVTKAGSGNDNCIVGNGMYSSGNGNALFGRYHIARKNRGLLAGTGHDTTNAKNEGVSAVGQYSYIDANTLFAVGDGTSHTARLNAFEVLSDGIVLRSPNGTRYKISVDNNGNISTTAI